MVGFMRHCSHSVASIASKASRLARPLSVQELHGTQAIHAFEPAALGVLRLCSDQMTATEILIVDQRRNHVPDSDEHGIGDDHHRDSGVEGDYGIFLVRGGERWSRSVGISSVQDGRTQAAVCRPDTGVG